MTDTTTETTTATPTINTRQDIQALQATVEALQATVGSLQATVEAQKKKIKLLDERMRWHRRVLEDTLPLGPSGYGKYPG